jgi:hypothetical protein
MRFLFFLLFLGLKIGSPLSAQIVRTLSPAAQISLMTVAPGEELYSTFGHSALRVQDPANGLDRIYNYGTFDFTQPNFYVNFCRGKLLYFLDLETYRSFERGNRADRRSQREQVLQLSEAQRAQLFQLLETNALPENREYKYDFFYDNCATRIRDVIRDAYTAQITWDSTRVPAGATMRQLLRPYVLDKPWVSFGFDLVLGIPTDRKATVEAAMFLPDYLHNALAGARLADGQSAVQAEFCSPIFEEKKSEKSWLEALTAPFAVMCGVAVLGLLSMWWPRAERIFDALFWFVLGVAGLIIAFLWLGTDHGATQSNLNLLWAWPTHLLFFWRPRRNNALTENYFATTSIVAGLLLAAWVFLPQELPYAALPIVILILVKGLVRLRQR